MDSNLCDVVREAYLAHLGDNFHCRVDRAGTLVLQTPFLTPDNDPIEIGIERTSDGRFRLGDLRSAYEYLYLRGLEISGNTNRTSLVNQIVSAYNVDIDRRELVVYATEADLGVALFRVICAEQRALDIIFSAQPGPLEKSFRIEVGEYLTQKQIHYNSNVRLSGYSIPHRIDFLVSNGMPRLIETLSASSRSDAEDAAIQTAFKWLDLKRIAPQYYTISVYDDTLPVWDSALAILRNNQSDQIFAWNQREQLVSQLQHEIRK